MTTFPKNIRLAVSACLLGQKVRYDGGHKHDHFVTGPLGEHMTLLPVCPEVDIGLGTPRESIHLLKTTEGQRLVNQAHDKDHTDAMEAYAHKKVMALQRQKISGFILKKDSPSCGMERVRVYKPNQAQPARNGRGKFAGILMDKWPQLPVEEEGRLHDPHLRENFIERVFAFRRVEDFFSSTWKAKDLIAFHTAQKLSLMAHHRPSYDKLGKLVAHAKGKDREVLAEEYKSIFMDALTHLAKRPQHMNVLQHMAGYFRKQLSKTDRDELSKTIYDFRKGFLPLLAPLTLMRHYVRLHQVTYLEGQTYLQPHPKELMLRHHV